jgi:hypothetical protein
VSGEIHIELWHAKFAGGVNPSVRSGDFEVVVSQGIKSRRWLKRRSLWTEIGNRLVGTSSPPIIVVDGSDDVTLLKSYLWRNDDDIEFDGIPWTVSFPNVRGTICIAQPGLSKDALIQKTNEDAASSIIQLLTVLSDTSMADALDIVVLGSE